MFDVHFVIRSSNVQYLQLSLELFSPLLESKGRCYSFQGGRVCYLGLDVVLFSSPRIFLGVKKDSLARGSRNGSIRTSHCLCITKVLANYNFCILREELWSLSSV